MKHLSKGPEETKQVAESFVKNLAASEKEAIVVGLVGDLGAGKTAFSQAVGEALGVSDIMQSPTFLIEKTYELADQPWKHLIHIDAYRLDKEDELLSLGWNEIISKPENLILVEWSDKLKNIFPRGAQTVYFKFIDENTREIEIR